jgi:hypothetical protein
VRRTNLVCGAFLLTLAAVSLLEAARVRDDWPGARLMPAVLGVVLAALGVAHLVGPAFEVEGWPDAPARRRLAVVFGALALYAAALPYLGFLPATALFVLFLVRVLGTFSWTAALVLTGAISIASDVVFVRWLGMPLPPGPLGL